MRASSNFKTLSGQGGECCTLKPLKAILTGSNLELLSVYRLLGYLWQVLLDWQSLDVRWQYLGF